jgi:paraquat-inducible protein A
MSSVGDAHDHLIACHECDFVQRHVDAEAGTTVRCCRCHGFLYRHPDKALDNAVAWSLTGLVLLVLANAFPVLDLSVSGHETSTTLISGAVALFEQDQFAVALLVVGVLVVAPTLLFLLQIYLLLPLRHNRVAPQFVPLMRLLSHLNHWLMFDVFMLALIVAVVKLSSLASVAPGMGLWAFLALMFASISSIRSYDTHWVWDCYSRLLGGAGVPQGLPASGKPTALSCQSATCDTCGLLSPLQSGEGDSRCPRCDRALHARKVDSLNRTWALLIAGYVLFIPANLLPITITSSLVGTQSDTIMSGVAYFWHEGAYDLAIIIFTASIFVPLLKLLSLTYLAWSAHKRMTWEPMQRTRLYRMVEFVGKWSMLDVFVVAMLARLVQFSALASIEAGPGALAFASVVVVTMFAAMSFDPRLIWDAQESTPHSGEKRG